MCVCEIRGRQRQEGEVQAVGDTEANLKSFCVSTFLVREK